MTATDYDAGKFYEGMVRAGLIIPVGVEGIFGRSAIFEDVLARLNDAITAVADEPDAVSLAFPPTISRKVLEAVDYMDNFPNLSGVIYSFFGKELTARKISELIHAGQPWGEHLGMTDVTLNPAACYPVYPTFKGTVPDAGKLVTLMSWVFRHEPSPEPTRMQSFRVREYVRCGTSEQVVQWRDKWLERGVKLLRELGLPAESDVASDPFFGRGGKMLAASQRDQKLKFEVLVPVISKEKPTAVCSFNYHEGHFGEVFGIKTPDGNVAQTACLGFGMERCVMALFQEHGFDPGAWPSATRQILWG